MTRRMKLLIAAAIGVTMAAGGTAYAFQADSAGSCAPRARSASSGRLSGPGPQRPRPRPRADDQVNIERRAAYTRLASTRGATIEEVAAATACQLFASRVGPGQYYRLPDGVWRQRNGNEPVPRPGHCG